MCALLLAAGADVRAQAMNDLATALFFKASRGDHAKAASLLRHAGSEPDALDVDRRSALTYAAEEGRIPMLQLLLGAGAAVDLAQRSNGKTPLMWVAEMGQLAMVELLLARGERSTARAPGTRRTRSCAPAPAATWPSRGC